MARATETLPGAVVRYDSELLPWLLAAPFRYGLGRPSRFRGSDVLPGIFYAAEDIATAVAETAYWRLVAFARSPGFRRPRTPTPMSAFAVHVASESALDGLVAGDGLAVRLLEGEVKDVCHVVGHLDVLEAQEADALAVAVLRPGGEGVLEFFNGVCDVLDVLNDGGKARGRFLSQRLHVFSIGGAVAAWARVRTWT